MTRSGRLGTATAAAALLLLVVAVSFLPAILIARDPVSACAHQPAREGTAVKATFSLLPAGVDCTYVLARADPGEATSTAFTGYPAWITALQVLLLVSAPLLVLLALWATIRDGRRAVVPSTG